jgi:hypothetical protein
MQAAHALLIAECRQSALRPYGRRARRRRQTSSRPLNHEAPPHRAADLPLSKRSLRESRTSWRLPPPWPRWQPPFLMPTRAGHTDLDGASETMAASPTGESLLHRGTPCGGSPSPPRERVSPPDLDNVTEPPQRCGRLISLGDTLLDFRGPGSPSDVMPWHHV